MAVPGINICICRLLKVNLHPYHHLHSIPIREKHYRKNNPKYIIKDRTKCFDDDYYYFACTTEREREREKKYAD